MKTLFQMSLLLFWMTTAAVAALFAQTDNERLKRIDEKLMPESYESYRRLIDEYPDGKKKEFTVFSVKKGLDKVAMIFLAPASEKGRTTLRLGENMWLYLTVA